MSTWTDIEIPASIARDPVKLSRFIQGVQAGAAGAAELLHPYTPLPFTGRMCGSVEDTYANADWIKENIQITREIGDMMIDETNKRSYKK